MIAYLDASALAKLYVEEENSPAVRRLLADTTAATSRLSEVEITSALARRTREGDLDEETRDRLLLDLSSDLTSLYVVELVTEVVTSARDLLTRHALRAADSIQLASALVLKQRLGSRVVFVNFDERLQAAALLEDLDVTDNS